MKILFFTAIFLFQIGIGHAAETENTLCLKQEDTLFNCETAKKKLISLCEIKSSSKAGIEYRYGTIGKAEISYKSDAESQNKFFQGTAYGGKISTKLIWFNKGPYMYVIFAADWGADGIAVLRDNKLLNSHECSEKSDIAIGNKNRWIEDRSDDEALDMLSKILH
jgi:hypothetical protein